MNLKEEFMKTEDPQKLLELARKISQNQFDKEMFRHFNLVAKKLGNGETPENHSDPREAFRKR